MSLFALGLILFLLGFFLAVKILYIIGIILLVAAGVLFLVSELPRRRR